SAASRAGDSSSTSSGAPAMTLPSRRNSRYCGMRITPCESCPRKLDSTRLRATTIASAAGTPAASKSACEKASNRSAVTVGTAGSRGERMRYLVEPWERTAGGVKQQVYLLTSPDTAVQAEVWPQLGCNCLR